ncbi:MAG: carbon-nitrogen hydrolase family protein [Chloroflexi bacterium]|nr:MAG: carbon-nitrogen hydrolase family protein [Chloroflexota bacterium]
MEKRISLATTQLDVTPAPLAERLARAESLVTRAARAGAQLVALPELFNTGYAYRDENFALAETVDGPTAQWMKQVSSRLGIHLAGSLLLRDGQDIYNALLLYAPDGRVWRYDKNYPWGWERAYFRERRAITIAETDLGSIGMMLCWDMAHAELWQQYAGKVDLMLACSCPPNLSQPIYHFPDGSQITGAQMGPVFASMRQAELQVFADTPAQQCAWLGVPFISSTACGQVDTPLPNPMGSFLGFLPAAPWLVGHLPKVGQMKVRAGVVEAARILAADGRQLAGLCSEQGETFVLSEVAIPAERPQPRGKQPRPPVSWIMYFVSDTFLTSVSLGTYARRPLYNE